jgi:predicted O-methyltransferase YrrM
VSELSDHELLDRHVLNLYGNDLFAHVRDDSEQHRQAHGLVCGVYPSNPLTMRLVSTLVRAVAAKRIVEIGCGLGYSALNLAAAAGPGSRVDTIDRFSEHVSLARQYATEAGLADRLNVIQGDGTDVLANLSGPYDLAHDDAWFAAEPQYLESMIDLVRQGGLIVISNWFLLEDAVTGKSQRDWSAEAGSSWADDIRSYARRLASHPRLHLSFAMRPWLGLGVKLE